MKDYKNLKVDFVWAEQHFYSHPNGLIVIDWVTDDSYGSVEMVMDNNGIPHTKTKTDREFLEALFKNFVEQIVIEE